MIELDERQMILREPTRAKHALEHAYRYMRPEEARLLHPGQHVEFTNGDGVARRIKVNGAPRTWKRDASRVELPCKYGLYECATFYARDGRMTTFGGRASLVVRC
jgi:hypothetical protein